MTATAGLQARFRALGDAPALIWRDETTTFAELAEAVDSWANRVEPGVVALVADYSPTAIALFLGLLAKGAVVALIGPDFAKEQSTLLDLAEIERVYRVEGREVALEAAAGEVRHPLLRELRGEGRAGIVLFSSGSSGRPKAVVHDAARLLAKYDTPRRAARTLPFMLFDHIGGLNTLLHTLSSGGAAVLPEDRRPETIAGLVERHRVEVLPTSPTFVNLLLLADVSRFDMSSLHTLAYGAERMPPPTLARLKAALPNVRLVQSYGMSEVGILKTSSESAGSLWVKLGGDGYRTRVKDGLLEIRAATAMLGYLNEESPFTEDGWVKTGDRVEVKGEYFRILGRASDLIIVGGEKVYPAEVEDHLLGLDGVVEAKVRGDANAITGQMVCATVRLSTGEARAAFRKRMRAALQGRLPDFKIPQRVTVTDAPMHGARFKRAP